METTSVLSTAPKLIHIFGHPVSTSVASVFHDHVLKLLNLPWEVSPIDSSDLQDLRRAIEAPQFGGAVITLPYKFAVMPLMDQLTDEAKVLGSANTVYLEEPSGKRVVVGTNTDWTGMSLAIRDRAPRLDRKAETVAVVIGRGILCRTAIYALAKGLGIEYVYVLDNTEDDFPAFSRVLQDVNVSVHIHCLSSVDALDALSKNISIIINADRNQQWSQETEPDTLAVVRACFEGLEPSNTSGVFLDMSSLPPAETELTRYAQDAGWQVASFLDFLKYTATQQFSLFTGLEIDQIPSKEGAKVVADVIKNR